MTRQSGHLRYHLLLLMTAAIWGTAFVFQEIAVKAGLQTFSFNAMRFLLGGVLLLPLMLVMRRRTRRGMIGVEQDKLPASTGGRGMVIGGVLMGLVLAAGSAFQQAGLADEQTTAGKAGFITGLYVVLVPLIGLLLGRRTDLWLWLGALLALSGLFFLSINLDRDQPTMGQGDLLVLMSTGFWALHILLIDHLSKRYDALPLAVIQCFVSGAISGVVALLLGEQASPDALAAGWYAIAYCGVMAVAVAFTMQVVAQKHAHPTAAAVIMSCEVLFAAAAGAILLGETMSGRDYLGCALMLIGMLISQLAPAQPAVPITPESA